MLPFSKRVGCWRKSAVTQDFIGIESEGTAGSEHGKESPESDNWLLEGAKQRFALDTTIVAIICIGPVSYDSRLPHYPTNSTVAPMVTEVPPDARLCEGSSNQAPALDADSSVHQSTRIGCAVPADALCGEDDGGSDVRTHEHRCDLQAADIFRLR